MIKILTAAGAACALVGAASAFDNSTCTAYLTSGWNAELTVSEKVQYMHVEYEADGTAFVRYDKKIDGALKPGKPIKVGTWAVKAGSSADKCAYSLNDTGEWRDLTVVDENTHVVNGTIYRRGS